MFLGSGNKQCVERCAPTPSLFAKRQELAQQSAGFKGLLVSAFKSAAMVNLVLNLGGFSWCDLLGSQ